MYTLSLKGRILGQPSCWPTCGGDGYPMLKPRMLERGGNLIRVTEQGQGWGERLSLLTTCCTVHSPLGLQKPPPQDTVLSLRARRVLPSKLLEEVFAGSLLQPHPSQPLVSHCLSGKGVYWFKPGILRHILQSEGHRQMARFSEPVTLTILLG